MSHNPKTCWVIFDSPEGHELFEGVYSEQFPSTFQDMENIEIQGNVYYVHKSEVFKTQEEALFSMNLRGIPVKKINYNDYRIVEFVQ